MITGGVPGPVPIRGSQAAAYRRKALSTMEIAARLIDQWSVIVDQSTEYHRPAMNQPSGSSKPPPAIVLWWEALETWVQLAISFPIFAVLTFLLNIGPFNQPIFRSVLYGLFEGGVIAGLLAVATATERSRRRS